MSTATMKKMALPRGGTPEPASSMGRDASRPRSSTPTGGSSPAPVRTRSMRQSASISARGAARQSPLSNGSSGSASSGDTASQADEDARAEAATRIQDLQERLAAAEAEKSQISKQTDVLQARLDEAARESARLEEKAHECEEQVESLQLEKRELSKQVRDMGSVYEAERSSMNKEKDEMADREEELQAIIQRLKDSLAQRNNNNAPSNEDEARPAKQDTDSPSVNGDSFAPPSSLNRSDSRNNSKLLLQKDKLIESLRLELAEAQIKLVESENQGGGRLQEVERLLMEARMSNARLVEDNESYQLLLQEKTLAGDFKSDFSYMGRGSQQDALNALEGRTSQVGDRSESGDADAVASSSLADELSDAAEIESENFRRVEAELKNMKEQNKALSLYINKIIERLLEHQDFEHILDQSSDGLPKPPNTNKDLPPPPAATAAPSAGANILQRAKFMATGAGNTSPTSATSGANPGPVKLRPRPMSFMPTQGPNSAHTDPERAPSIPIGNLGRAASVRRARPMSEQYTSSNAASLVSQMYHGGSGPSSPPLGPVRSQSFFSPGSIGNPNAAARHPSGHAYSTSGGHSASGNFPGMRSSDASSTTSGDSGDVATVSSPGHSPSRASSVHSTTTFAGNKPRPLRLVQENSESVKPEPNKRASWMPWGWGSGAAAKKEDLSTMEPTRE